MARMRCLAAGLSGASEMVRAQRRASFNAPSAAFGAAIGEEDAIHAGDFGELTRERALISIVVEVLEGGWRARLGGE